MGLLRKVRDSKFVRFLVRFSLAIAAVEIAVLLYFYDLPELWETYLRLTGLDKYIH
jgi:hypothetical protein